MARGLIERGIVIGAFLWMGFGAGCSGSAPHDIVTSVPMGSSLSKLDRWLERGKGSQGEVTGTIVLGEERIEFKQADYDTWYATPAARDTFTGTVTFYHFSFTSSDVNEVSYADGKLVGKEWGFLPG